MNPFRRRRHDARTEEALRRSLNRHAGNAPGGDWLAERIIAAVDEPDPRADGYVPRARRRLASWVGPAVAAAGVAAIAAVVVGVTETGDDAPHPAQRSYSSLRGLQPAPSSSHSPKPAPHTPRPTQQTRTSTATSTSPPVLSNPRITDLTFTGDGGFALGSADCLQGVEPRCPAAYRNTGNALWTSTQGTAFNVPDTPRTGECAAPCVEHVRFATDQLGYAYGPRAFYTTTDGGRDWTREPGGAVALETYFQNTIRIVANDPACGSACGDTIETAPLNSTAWTPATGPGATKVGGDGAVQLVRSGESAYVLSVRSGKPGDNGTDWAGSLISSTDLGHTWTAHGDPCQASGTDFHATGVSAGNGAHLTVLCSPVSGHGSSYVTTSSDGGSSFTPQSGAIPAGAAGGLLTGSPDTVLLSGGDDGVERSIDGGVHWQPVSGPSGQITFVGSESTTTARVVADGGRSIWTTRDAGATWHRAVLR